MFPQNGGSTVVIPDGLSLKYNRSSATDISDILAICGYKFRSTKIFSGFTTATPFYSLFENPVDSGVVVILEERHLKPYSGGIQNFHILWDYDVSTSTKTAMPTYNQNNRYRYTKLGKAEVSALNTLSSTPSVGDWPISGAATIEDDGFETEPNFSSTTGIGVNTAGGVVPDIGARVYWPGTGFLTKAVSATTGNRLLWGYEWYEIPIEWFSAE